MKKIFAIIGIGILLLAASGVFAATEIKHEVQNFVEDIVEKKGIETNEIQSIEEVDFNDLPEQIDVENIDDTNLAVYEVQLENEKSVFAITATGNVEGIKKQTSARSILNFGFNGKMTQPGFLKTATGVESSLDNGYVMMRDGSITGMSTSLNILEEDSSTQIEIIIYKNGEAIGFGNTLEASLGTKKDFDVQSEGTVSFEAGDTISVYTNTDKGISWENVITMIEITSE